MKRREHQRHDQGEQTPHPRSRRNHDGHDPRDQDRDDSLDSYHGTKYQSRTLRRRIAGSTMSAVAASTVATASGARFDSPVSARAGSTVAASDAMASMRVIGTVKVRVWSP